MSEAAQSAVAEAEVAAHTILLPRGTYCIYVLDVAANVPPDRLPGLAVSAAPGEDGGAVEVARLAGEPWLRRQGDGVLVRVHAAEVRLLLTSYNLARTLGATPPKIEVHRLDPPRPVSQAEPVEQGQPGQVSVHLRDEGDRPGRFGEWVGDRGGDVWIEGFSILPPSGLEAADLEYRAVLGKGWLSPWVKAGQYCGSRGMRLPVLGVQVRLNGSASEKIGLAVSAAFVDGSTSGPVKPGDVCAMEPLQPVAALHVEIVPPTRTTSTEASNASDRPTRAASSAARGNAPAIPKRVQ